MDEARRLVAEIRANAAAASGQAARQRSRNREIVAALDERRSRRQIRMHTRAARWITR